MRLFKLLRTEDVSGVSGVGYVAQGVEFDDGQCVMLWLTENANLSIYPDIKTLINIHGHGGSTEIIWVNQFDEYRGQLSSRYTPRRRKGKSIRLIK